MRLQTRGALRDLLAWADAFDTRQPALLERTGLAGDVVLEGSWDVQALDTLRARATLRRASGELRLLAIDSSTTTVRSGNAPATLGKQAGAAAGLQAAQIELELQGERLRAAVLWDSARAGRLQAEAAAPCKSPPGAGAEHAGPRTPRSPPVKAQLPELGVWSAMAPPGWRVQGTLDADVQLSGTRADPRWHGQLRPNSSHCARSSTAWV